MTVRNIARHDRVDPDDLITEGGAEHQTVRKRIRQKDQFPADSKDFYPPRINDEEQIRRVMNRIQQTKQGTRPKQVLDLEVNSLLTAINGRNFCMLTVWFIQDNDPNYHAARVWIKGYMTGNALGLNLGTEETLPFTQAAQAQRSPISFVLEKTSEQVVIGVEPINEDGIGAGLDLMPTQTITLDGI